MEWNFSAYLKFIEVHFYGYTMMWLYRNEFDAGKGIFLSKHFQRGPIEVNE